MKTIEKRKHYFFYIVEKIKLFYFPVTEVNSKIDDQMAEIKRIAQKVRKILKGNPFKVVSCLVWTVIGKLLFFFLLEMQVSISKLENSGKTNSIEYRIKCCQVIKLLFICDFLRSFLIVSCIL